jgi:NhaP-type Na+/H+ and K+/H+ antiporter
MMNRILIYLAKMALGALVGFLFAVVYDKIANRIAGGLSKRIASKMKEDPSIA